MRQARSSFLLLNINLDGFRQISIRKNPRYNKNISFKSDRSLGSGLQHLPVDIRLDKIFTGVNF